MSELSHDVAGTGICKCGRRAIPTTAASVSLRRQLFAATFQQSLTVLTEQIGEHRRGDQAAKA